MPQPYCQVIIVCAAASLLCGNSLLAQTTTDFAAWKDAKNVQDVPRWVYIMLNRDFRGITGTARDELLAKTLAELKEIIADPNVVPSTRYNAILAVGQLESTPGNPPAAYSAALPYLVDVYQKPDCPPYVKYGALLGIARHALCGIDPSHREKVIDLLLETVTNEFIVSDTELLEPAVANWFRQTSLDGLTALKTVGTDGKIVAELLSVIRRKSQELNELCRSENTLTRENWEQARRAVELASKTAKTLGDLDYKSATGIDANKMTDAFIAFTKAVCGFECKAATDSVEQGEASPDPAILLEQIVLDIKTCTQSVVWGIRGGLLTGKPTENSFYASLGKDNSEAGRLDILLGEIVELTAFLDEGSKANRSTPAFNAPKAFNFDLPELRNTLSKSSEVFAKIQSGNHQEFF